MNRSSILAWLCTIFFVCSHAAAQNKNSPQLTVESNRLVASNFSPGSTVIAYSVGFQHDGYYDVTRLRILRLVDTDKDGVVIFPLAAPAPLRSVWIAVDERNADFAVASPSGYSPIKAVMPSFRKHGAAVDEIEWTGHAAYLLYVHPGLGAWTGFSNDATPGNGRAPGDYVSAFLLSQLHPLIATNAGKPEDIKPGGTLFLVDAYDLRTAAVKIDGAMIGGAK